LKEDSEKKPPTPPRSIQAWINERTTFEGIKMREGKRDRKRARELSAWRIGGKNLKGGTQGVKHVWRVEGEKKKKVQ